MQKLNRMAKAVGRFIVRGRAVPVVSAAVKETPPSKPLNTLGSIYSDGELIAMAKAHNCNTFQMLAAIAKGINQEELDAGRYPSPLFLHAGYMDHKRREYSRFYVAYAGHGHEMISNFIIPTELPDYELAKWIEGQFKLGRIKTKWINANWKEKHEREEASQRKAA